MSQTSPDLNLSHLTQAERDAYSRISAPNNLAWFTALLCAAYASMGVFLVFQQAGSIHFPSILKVVVFVALGWWARRWSRIACMLLLAWHLYMNFAFAGSARMNFKLFFWIPAILFLASLFFTVGRASLIKKAQQAAP